MQGHAQNSFDSRTFKRGTPEQREKIRAVLAVSKAAIQAAAVPPPKK